MREGAELELLFTDLLANGQGVGRADGLVVFCFGPLPEERARVRISEVKPRYAVAHLVKLISQSARRAVPFCPVFGDCGGCQLQHLEYPAQLAWKRDVVRQALARIGDIGDVEVRATIGMAEPRAYRNKMALVVDRRSKLPALGFYRQRSHEVVAIDRCPVVAPKLDDLLQRLDNARGEPPMEQMLRETRHLVARSAAATGEVVLTITSDRRSPAAAAAAVQLVRDVPGLNGVENSFGLASENAILGRKHQLLAGTLEIDEVIAGVRYRLTTGSFFQINTEIVARIFEMLRPRLAQAGRIVDLYCGVGTFALFFARQGWSVVGIEEDARAVAQARANAHLNRLERYVRFETGRVEETVASPKVAPALRDASAVFLDPPRKGSDEATLGAIARVKPPQVWYLSCDPATLARDLKFLIAKGYRITAVQPFDMFPHTGHVESLALLEAGDA
ncbi:MAG: 23S rRNA (uracil(1939)-C(5))-methyltransferase RlmD [Candidatus Eremiobacteraeota bacterium]|nr:23S rRNA (uracil(1939)-C(5))-methyltransferase RlmD [Candidatus Eremiobacteraeota bacterium]